MLRGLGASMLLLGIASPAAALSVQEALLRSKPAVALVMSEVTADVTLRCGGVERATKITPLRESGTGWFVAANGSLMTNGHVVSVVTQPLDALSRAALESAVRETCLPTLLAQRRLTPGERPDVERDLVQAMADAQRSTARVAVETSIRVILSNGSKFTATVLKYSPPVSPRTMSGRDLALLQVDVKDVPSLPLVEGAAAKIGDTVYIIGFPGIVLKHELLSEAAQFEASVTKGSVAGLREDVNGHPVIQTDAEAVWGNSGGPAVDAMGRVIGMLTFVRMESANGRDAVQGFNFVIPAAAIEDFLGGTGTPINRPSSFNKAWHAALRDFFAGRHTKAARRLREVDHALPDLPDVRRITAANDELIKHPPRRRLSAAVLTVAGTSVGAVAASVIGLLRRRRNRFRIAPREVARLLALTPPPIILDARDAETYDRSPVRLPGAIHVTADSLAHEATARSLDHDRLVVAYCT